MLLLHRSLPRDSLLAGIWAALAIGPVDAEVVAIEARKIAERAVATVVPIGALSRYDRPKPTLNGYDTLLEAARDDYDGHRPLRPPLGPAPGNCTFRPCGRRLRGWPRSPSATG